MGALLKIILVTIVVFFVWNILKRLFFKNFYSHLLNEKTKTNSTKETKEKPVKWDAETIDYEEINPNIKK